MLHVRAVRSVEHTVETVEDVPVSRLLFGNYSETESRLVDGHLLAEVKGQAVADMTSTSVQVDITL